jgi:DNA-binding transcriptional LysR family regulator
VIDIVDMPNPSETGPVRLPSSDGATPAPQGVELRHLRYFVAAADAGTLTRAAEQIFIAQPTLSQQIRRLEEMVGTPLLQRRREGLRLTAAGSVLLEEARTVLSLVDHSVSRARQVAGLGRPRLRVIIPPHLPEGLAVETASRLRGAADAAGVDVAWMETSFAFSLIREQRADAGLCWLPPAGESLPARIDAMNLGEFEPDVWIPSAHPTARHGTISLDELARMTVIIGSPRIWSAMYDAWLGVLRTASPRFEFTDPPFRNSLPITLAFAASGNEPTAVLTGPQRFIAAGRPTQLQRGTDTYDMVCVRLEQSPLVAAAGLVWSGDLPRQLQQILFDAADGMTI